MAQLQEIFTLLKNFENLCNDSRNKDFKNWGAISTTAEKLVEKEKKREFHESQLNPAQRELLNHARILVNTRRK